MKNDTYALIALTLLTLTAFPVSADDTHVMMPMDGKIVEQSYQGTGKINSVDEKAGRINLSHETIPGLERMPATMDFGVLDNDMLANLKQGQKVAFKLIEVRKGKYMISEIRAVK
ncbi:MAG: copper-binding protein [Gallionella sp.]